MASLVNNASGPIHEPPAMATQNQFQLLRQRRFAPFFWTQFLGAGNDNIYKNALVIFVAYHAAAMLDTATHYVQYNYETSFLVI